MYSETADQVAALRSSLETLPKNAGRALVDLSERIVAPVGSDDSSRFFSRNKTRP